MGRDDILPIMKIATIGFFDGVHRGHQHLCRQLRSLAGTDGSTLVLTFDRHPQRVLGRRDAPALLTSNAEKAYFLENVCGIDDVVFLDFTVEMAALSARDFMETYLRDTYGVTHLVIGYDHHFGRPLRDAFGNRIDEGFDDYQRYGRELGIEVVLATELPGDEHVSSSAIRHCLGEGDVAAANRLLGYDFCLTGTVTSGHQVGRKIGFPTANLVPLDDSILIPAPGVYVTRAYVFGRDFPAVTNIGHRPTLNNGEELSVETHFLGVERMPDLYEQRIMVTFFERLRDEQRFDSVDDLKAQIARDIEAATNYHRRHASPEQF